MTTRGERLRSYVLAKTGGKPGWQKALVVASGVKRQTITKYTKATFDTYPELGTLAQLADGLGVSLSEIVAAMEDEPMVRLDGPAMATIRAAIEQALDERLGPRRAPRRPGDAT